VSLVMKVLLTYETSKCRQLGAVEIALDFLLTRGVNGEGQLHLLTREAHVTPGFIIFFSGHPSFAISQLSKLTCSLVQQTDGQPLPRLCCEPELLSPLQRLIEEAMAPSKNAGLPKVHLLGWVGASAAEPCVGRRWAVPFVKLEEMHSELANTRSNRHEPMSH
jgi:hypothetical protein